MSLSNELKRRNVLRVGAAYVVVAWLINQVMLALALGELEQAQALLDQLMSALDASPSFVPSMTV